jgi:hypothetical protein
MPPRKDTSQSTMPSRPPSPADDGDEVTWISRMIPLSPTDAPNETTFFDSVDELQQHVSNIFCFNRLSALRTYCPP